MFANLRVASGSNHFVLPTGLLLGTPYLRASGKEYLPTLAGGVAAGEKLAGACFLTAPHGPSWPA